MVNFLYVYTISIKIIARFLVQLLEYEKRTVSPIYGICNGDLMFNFIL